MFCESVFCNRSVSSKQQLSKLDARWLFLREHIHKIKVPPHPPSYPTDKLCFAQEVPWHKGNIKKNHISYEHLHNSPFFSMQGWPCKIENPDTAQRGCSKLKLCTGNWTVRRMEREKELLCNIVDCYAEGLLVQMSHLMVVILYDILYVKRKIQCRLLSRQFIVEMRLCILVYIHDIQSWEQECFCSFAVLWKTSKPVN